MNQLGLAAVVLACFTSVQEPEAPAQPAKVAAEPGIPLSALIASSAIVATGKVTDTIEYDLPRVPPVDPTRKADRYWSRGCLKRLVVGEFTVDRVLKGPRETKRVYFAMTPFEPSDFCSLALGDSGLGMFRTAPTDVGGWTGGASASGREHSVDQLYVLCSSGRGGMRRTIDRDVARLRLAVDVILSNDRIDRGVVVTDAEESLVLARCADAIQRQLMTKEPRLLRVQANDARVPIHPVTGSPAIGAVFSTPGNEPSPKNRLLVAIWGDGRIVWDSTAGAKESSYREGRADIQAVVNAAKIANGFMAAGKSPIRCEWSAYDDRLLHVTTNLPAARHQFVFGTSYLGSLIANSGDENHPTDAESDAVLTTWIAMRDALQAAIPSEPGQELHGEIEYVLVK